MGIVENDKAIDLFAYGWRKPGSESTSQDSVGGKNFAVLT